MAGGGIARGRRAVELRRRGGSVQCHRRPRRGRQRARAASAACWRGRAPRRRDGHASPPRRRRGALVGRRALATWRNEPMKAPHRAAQRGRRPPPPPPRVDEHLHHHSASGARPPSPRERAAKQYACARRAHASGIRHALHAEARERSARACVAEAARRRSDGSMASYVVGEYVRDCAESARTRAAALASAASRGRRDLRGRVRARAADPTFDTRARRPPAREHRHRIPRPSQHGPRDTVRSHHV